MPMPSRGYVYIKKKKVPGQTGHWPETKKIQALTAFFTSGSYAFASAETKVPIDTIKRWRFSEWGREFEQQLNDEDNQTLDAKFTKIIQKTLSVIEDRLDNGNFMFDPKTGKVTRVPVNLRDTHRVMSDVVTKRKDIRSAPTEDAHKETQNDRILKLAEQFAAIASKKEKDISDPITGVSKEVFDELVIQPDEIQIQPVEQVKTA